MSSACREYYFLVLIRAQLSFLTFSSINRRQISKVRQIFAQDNPTEFVPQTVKQSVKV
jgi:hypothetical protein